MVRRPSYDDYTASGPGVGRKVVKIVAGLVVTLLLLGGAVVILDMAARDFTQARARDQVASRLPAGSGDVQVSIGGFSFFQQLLSGSFDDVGLSFTMSEGALTQLASEGGFAGQMRLVGSGITVEGKVDVLGVAVPYTIDLDPSLDGGYLVLTATGVSAAEAVDIDLTQFVDLATVGAKVCTASLLPESIRLTKVEPEGGVLRFEAVGTGVPVDLDQLMTRGSCDEVAPGTEAPADTPAEAPADGGAPAA
ncbi:DUF2993 family protein [Homoserinimonas aerilata]|uniref:DUF2993 family protein n=1 Tax=Homoserinimonas aerilata TaxID=1162970 RepID=A0A542YK98_9MICO|nr:LmeA family phospholipid-binding protein [Homoserinimonas aerilata]TQL48526.1 DUF2993 family protein [Homoserinimonas aerilata]